MARRNKISIDNYLKWLFLIPTSIGAFGFIISGLMIVPDHWREYKEFKKDQTQIVNQLVKKVYGASPDDMDGIRASIQKEIEHDEIIKDAKILIPLTKKLFETDLPALKNRVKNNEEYIKKIKKTLGN